MKANADLGVNSVYKVIANVIKDACDEAGVKTKDLAAIGGCAPGLVEPQTGLVYDTPNLGFKDFPLQQKLSDDFNVPVHIENDVNAGLYAELHFGAAQGMRNVIGISPGTGVGGAIVIGGQLYRGNNGGAAEFGHIIVQPDGQLCGCGQRGCLETIASRTALSQQILSFAVRGRIPMVIAEAKGNLKKVKSGLISRAYNSGDPDVKEIVHYAARYLGVGMSNLVNCFNPEAVILGGGLIEALPQPFVEISSKVMRETAMNVNSKDVKVLPASLGDDAVIKGTAKLASELIQT
jgi:glucokinase